MKIYVIKGEELDKNLENKWSRIQKSNSIFSSPFFCPQFIRIVAMVRDDVFVSVIEDENKIIGFFPFQRRGNNIGEPVGAGISDYQGIIIEDNIVWNVEKIIRGSNLLGWEFDHLIMDQENFKPHFRLETSSPIIDLKFGFKQYRHERRNAGTKQILQIERRLRQLEKEIGEVQFEVHSNDVSKLQWLIELKSDQFRRTGAYDHYSHRWVVKLHKMMQRLNGGDFSGLFSILYSDGKPIAAHMGMRSHETWHWWFPVYDKSFSKYSPGLILLLKMAEVSESIGIKTIDLGKVTYHYKKRMMNREISIAEGAVYLK